MNHTLGIIGSGNIGGAVARLAVDAGIDVVLSNSRGPETLRGLTGRLGYDTVDAGATTESWRVQEGSPAYVLPYLSDPRLPWPRDPGKPADAKEIRTALEGARSRP